LRCALFNGTELEDVDFGNSDLHGTRFIDTDLSGVNLTVAQRQQAIFENTMGTSGIESTSKIPTTMTTQPLVST
jgi:uncharacterized protein YjbI with pentapeptide repeats